MDKFARRIETHIPGLRRYARALLRDVEQADDLVQDCIERALSRRRLWRGSGELRPWLFTIMHNIHANQMRSLSRQPTKLPLSAAETRGTPARQTDQVAVAEVVAALNKMPEEQRQVILLVAVEGFRYAEAAETLGIPIGTVMSRLSRGRAALRSLMENEGATLRRVK